MDDERQWTDVGARIAACRRSRGLSQEYLAAELGLDRTAVTKIEAGRRHVNSLELVRLADVLDRPLDWFVSSPPASIISRRAAVAGGRGDERSDYAIEDVSRDLAILVSVQVLAANNAKGTLRALESTEGARSPEEAASEARKLIGVTAGSPIHDLAEHVERAGLFPYSLALGQSSADGAYAEVDGLGVAVINGDADPGRRRHTLAHELGHHLFGDAYSADWGADTSEAEQSLDAFASYLLLPRRGVRTRWNSLRKTYQLRHAAIILSAEFRVSWTTTLLHLLSFNLITRDEQRLLDSRSPTRADYLECNVRVVEEMRPPYIPTGISAAAIRAYKWHRLSAERVVDMLRGQVEVDDLPERDEIPLESIRGDLRLLGPLNCYV